MKKLTDNQKIIKSFRNLNKEGLFLPIFYTAIFGLGILSVLVLPESEVQNRWFIIIGSGLVIVFFWAMYIYGKKREKSLNSAVDQLEVELVKTNDELPIMDLVEEKNQKQRIQSITDTLKVITTSSIIFIVSFAIVSITNLLQELFECSHWLFITVYIVFGIGILSSLIIWLLSYIKLNQYAKKV